MDTKNRNISLDLLRIVAMIFIVIGHIISHGTVKNNLEFSSINYLIVWGLLAFVIVAVNCYIFISGYFLSEQEDLKTSKIYHLVKITFFYSVATFFILLFIKQTNFNISLIPRVFLPIVTFSYWFMTVYFLMYLFFPYYNLLIQQFDKQTFKKLLITGFIILSVFPMIFIIYIPKLSGIGFLLWFTYLYFVSAYIRKYYVPPYKPIKYLIGYIICCLLVVSSKYIFTIINFKLNQNLGTAFLYEHNSFLIFFASLFLFMFFLNLRIPNKINFISKFIVLFSSATLPVYLITEQFAMRTFLWKKLFVISNNLHPYFLLTKMIIIGVFVFLVCSLIEIFRKFIVLKLIK